MPTIAKGKMNLTASARPSCESSPIDLCIRPTLPHGNPGRIMRDGTASSRGTKFLDMATPMGSWLPAAEACGSCMMEWIREILSERTPKLTPSDQKIRRPRTRNLITGMSFCLLTSRTKRMPSDWPAP